MALVAAIMIIRYNNGQTFEAALLSRTEDTMRVAARGSEDVLELKQIHGTWITDDCEPVQVEFAWERRKSAAAVTEAECICPRELAARLIHLLVSGEDETRTAGPAARGTMALPSYEQVV